MNFKKTLLAAFLGPPRLGESPYRKLLQKAARNCAKNQPIYQQIPEIQ
jgi:hypothetical protein